MTQLTQLIVQGISTCAIYGLFAFGLVLSYKATEALKFAQGDVVMLSAFIGWGLIVAAGLPLRRSSLLVLGIRRRFAFSSNRRSCSRSESAS
jgi:branched-chain amino acid transport system permease protein